MTKREDLKPGKFYWIIPNFDTGFIPPGWTEHEDSEEFFKASWDHWFNNKQPALFEGFAKNGEERWVFLGVHWEQDQAEGTWTPNWIGDEIVDSPRGPYVPLSNLTGVRD